MLKKFYIKINSHHSNCYHIMESGRKNEFGEEWCIESHLPYYEAMKRCDELNQPQASEQAVVETSDEPEVVTSEAAFKVGDKLTWREGEMPCEVISVGENDTIGVRWGDGSQGLWCRASKQFVRVSDAVVSEAQGNEYVVKEITMINRFSGEPMQQNALIAPDGRQIDSDNRLSAFGRSLEWKATLLNEETTALRQRIAELNAKVDTLYHDLRVYGDNIHGLQAENASLKEENHKLHSEIQSMKIAQDTDEETLVSLSKSQIDWLATHQTKFGVFSDNGSYVIPLGKDKVTLVGVEGKNKFYRLNEKYDTPANRMAILKRSQGLGLEAVEEKPNSSYSPKLDGESGYDYTGASIMNEAPKFRIGDKVILEGEPDKGVRTIHSIYSTSDGEYQYKVLTASGNLSNAYWFEDELEAVQS